MFSDPIVAMIDEEIDRLRKVRAIFASLLDLPRVPKTRPTMRSRKRVEALPVVANVPTILRLPPREPRLRRPRLPKPVEQPLALRGAIPTSPVVVRPSSPKPIERAPEPQTKIEPGSFAALVRVAERELQMTA